MPRHLLLPATCRFTPPILRYALLAYTLPPFRFIAAAIADAIRAPAAIFRDIFRHFHFDAMLTRCRHMRALRSATL